MSSRYGIEGGVYELTRSRILKVHYLRGVREGE
jgi:hypothetical protein